jgi:uncharacterized protein (DUF433 family)
MLRERSEKMSKEYVVKIDETYTIADSRVSLDSVVYAWLQGQSADAIADSFPVLTLEEVYGAITFYLSHRAEVDAYLQTRKVESEAKRRKSVEALRERRPQLYAKLMAAQTKAVAVAEPELVYQ